MKTIALILVLLFAVACDATSVCVEDAEGECPDVIAQPTPADRLPLPEEQVFENPDSPTPPEPVVAAPQE